MFGKNQLLKQVRQFDGTYWVQDVFKTIQGEGPLTGMPAVFIRLAGCNLRCHFCDTDFESSNMRPNLGELGEEVVRKANGVVKLVVLTGGEPMRQPLGPLVALLQRLDMQVQIETAGTLWDKTLDNCLFGTDAGVLFVCSPKTGVINQTVIDNCEDYKYIVNTAPGNECTTDGLPLLSSQVRGHLAPLFRARQFKPDAQIWVQPETAYLADGGGEDVEGTRRNREHAVRLCLTYGYRLSLQTHRILGLP